jgi:hypothetical protein
VGRRVREKDELISGYRTQVDALFPTGRIPMASELDFSKVRRPLAATHTPEHDDHDPGRPAPACAAQSFCALRSVRDSQVGLPPVSRTRGVCGSGRVSGLVSFVVDW